MEIEFTKEETIKLIEEYYKKLEGRNVKITINAKKGYTGWYDNEACITTITVAEPIEIMGMRKEVKEIINEEQLKVILKALFDLYEFNLSNIVLNDGLNSRYEGYGMSEQVVKSAYFKGITVHVQKKKNVSLEKKF